MNNNYYIFLIHCISNIGGMQLYVSRKIEYLKTKGWIPIVYYYTAGDIEIPNLKEYNKNYIPELRQCVGNVPTSKRRKVITIISNDIIDPNKVIIESCCLALGTWGEYLSSIYKGKHILYIIDEIISSPTKTMEKFIRFKEQQNLLYCIKPKILSNVFPDEKQASKLQLRAVGCSANNISDDANPLVDNISKNSTTILSLGRLDKPYIPHLFDSIAEFSKQNKDLKFNLIIVGNTPYESSKSKLIDIVSKISNLNIIDLGYIWPIPHNIFEKADVAVGSAGSILLCSRQGIPSISIDVTDYEAIGIVGRNTQNSIFRTESDGKETIIGWLNRIIINKEYGKEKPQDNNIIDYSEHQKIIDNYFIPKYYPTEKSKDFVSHQLIRTIAIYFDQTNIGHKIIKYLWSKNWFNNIVNSINRNNYKMK